MFYGRFLVRGEGNDIPVVVPNTIIHEEKDTTTVNDHNSTKLDNNINNNNRNNKDDNEYRPIIVSDTPISFWGGIDPITSKVIDVQHPLYNIYIQNSILCIPSTRGSCTTSQVLLELLLHHIAPHTIIVRDYDALLCIGAIIAQECFQRTSQKCHIIYIGSKQYTNLLQLSKQEQQLFGRITSIGNLEIRDLDTYHNNLELINDNDSSGNNNNNYDDVVSSFTYEEQNYMNQCTTDAERMALRVIFRYAILSFMNNTNNINNLNNNNGTIHSMKEELEQQQQPQYIPIQQAHIDGCTYIGPGGIQFVQLLQKMGGKVKVPTTLNSVSTDQRYWEKYSVPKEYAHNSITLGNTYVALGCQPTFTCAPYLLLPPSQQQSDISKSKGTTHSNTISILQGQDIAWGESNAVVYANSVLGARTEKYADYLDICCAITGIVPKIGVHNTQQRIPTMIIDGTNTLESIQRLIDENKNNNDDTTTILDLDILFPILGHLCGRLSDGHVPILVGFEQNISYWTNIISTDHLKAFCAAFGTTASSPLIHIAGITPEAKDPIIVQSFISSCDTRNRRTIHILDLYETYQKFNMKNNTESIDLVALGNPHLSVSECYDLARIIQQVNANNNINDITKTSMERTKKAKTRIIACISRSIYEQANIKDIQIMQEFGIEFIYDTCWCMILDEPIIPHNPLATILTNSGKYAHYGPGLTNRSFRFGSMYDCIYAAQYGLYPTRLSSTQQQETSVTFNSSGKSIVQPKSMIDPNLSFLVRSSHHSNYQARQYSTHVSMITSNALLRKNQFSSTHMMTRKMAARGILSFIRSW